MYILLLIIFLRYIKMDIFFLCNKCVREVFIKNNFRILFIIRIFCYSIYVIIIIVWFVYLILFFILNLKLMSYVSLFLWYINIWKNKEGGE